MKIQKGDKIIVRGALTDADGNGLAFADLVSMTCKVEQEEGTDFETYTKGGVSPNDIVVNPNNANGYQFEVTPTHSGAFNVDTILYGVFTIVVSNTEFSSNQQDVVKRRILFEVETGG